MKDILDIYDEVEIIRTKQKSTIKEMTKVETKRLFNGVVKTEFVIRYGLEGFGMTYTADQLRYLGQKPIKESEIDYIITDALLLNRRFDHLKGLLAKSQDTRPDGYCNCGGEQYITFWNGGVEGLRCMDCGNVEY